MYDVFLTSIYMKNSFIALPSNTSIALLHGNRKFIFTLSEEKQLEEIFVNAIYLTWHRDHQFPGIPCLFLKDH